MTDKTDMQTLGERLRLLLSGDAILAKTDFARATIEQAIAALAARDAQAESGTIPADCDVRKILLRVVPGDGDGHEVYAKNIADVEQLLSEMGERLENFESARAAAPQAQGVPAGEVAARAKTVHRRIDALCEAANTPGADYFDASTSMLIATRDLLIALGYPHQMDACRAAAPSREHVGEMDGCCDTPSLCSSVRRCTAQDTSPSRECGEPPAENTAVRNKIAAALHYPDHWDTAAYPTLDDAAWEAIAAAKLTCSECGEKKAAGPADQAVYQSIADNYKRDLGEPGRPLTDFERVVLEYIAFNDGFINTRIRAKELLDGQVPDAPTLTDEQRAVVQKAADTAFKILIAGGDYGDELADFGLRAQLKDVRAELCALLAKGE